MMNKLILFMSAIVIATIGTGCASRDPFILECKNKTEAVSSARWNCLKDADIKRNAEKERLNLELMRNKCDEIGFKRGTDGFGQCILSLKQQEIDTNRPDPVINMPSKSTTCTHIPGTYTTTCR